MGYDRTNKQHHSLLLCLLMTSCDLSDQTKGWKTTRKIAVSATALWEGAGCTLCPALCGSLQPEQTFCAELSLAVFWGDRRLDHLRVTNGEAQKGAWTQPGSHSKSVAGGGWARTQPLLPIWGHHPAGLAMVRTGPEVRLRDASVCPLGIGL